MTKTKDDLYNDQNKMIKINHYHKRNSQQAYKITTINNDIEK